MQLKFIGDIEHKFYVQCIAQVYIRNPWAPQRVVHPLNTAVCRTTLGQRGVSRARDNLDY